MATTDSLRGARCAPGAPRLGDAEQRALMGGIASWGTDGASLERRLKVNDFKTALALVNQIGALAEAEGHHPDL
ncbi:MAG: 4a-hydroxytetrahydrobiopterin dehydratase, partial [Armatimonadetes bacterium]|nr:4a-hydroxytetrahydrobiopterin dehydratase [Armatimonadota bacterium]